MKEKFSRGIAFILEGDTEKVFYRELLEFYVSKHPGSDFQETQDDKSGEVYYELTTPNAVVIVKMFVVGTISQLTNSSKWFENFCCRAYPSLNWFVFLCYDTDSYKEPVTKFYEGDWSVLREQLSQNHAAEIVDLAAQADIEDIMLLDASSIFDFLGIEPCPIPSGSKGKRRMKKLFRSVGRGNAYHEGKRAKTLIKALDFSVIIAEAPVDFASVERACFEKLG